MHRLVNFVGPFLFTLAAPLALPAASNSYVYTMSNASNGNQILIYNRDTDGTLSYHAAVASGGNGTGFVLGSEGSIITNGKYVFAVNAGSNTISVFDGAGTLTLVGTISSGGTQPISLTYFAGYLYVLNSGSPNNITGFSFDSTTGILTPLPGSTQSLSGPSVGPGAVSFNKAGTALVVTEQVTNLIDVFAISNGVAGPLTSYHSHGGTPDGVAFGKNSQLFVAEAWVGSGKQSDSVSSYTLNSSNMLSLVSGSVPSQTTVTYCVAVSPNGQFVFASNLNNSRFSRWSVNNHGQLTSLSDVFVGVSAAQLADIAVSSDGLNLYVVDHGKGNVFAYSIDANGTLTQISGGFFAPSSASGLVVR